MATLFSLALHLKLAGLSLIGLGIAHAFFGPRFRWKEELARLSLLNRQIFTVHTFFIALILVLLGALSAFGTSALLEKSALARWFLSGVVIFWACRWICQFWVYDASLWRGKRFETAVHILFSVAWTYYVAVYGLALWRQLGQPTNGVLR